MRLVVYSVLLVSLSGAMFAQSTNDQEIAGIVQDASGAAVPNATVTATNPQTHFSRSVTSMHPGLC
jgi:hypothetical protein